MNSARATAEEVAGELMELNSMSSQMEIDAAAGFLNTREYMLSTREANNQDYIDAETFRKASYDGGVELQKRISASTNLAITALEEEAANAVKELDEYGASLKRSHDLFVNVFAAQQSMRSNFAEADQTFAQYIGFLISEFENPAQYSRIAEIMKRVAPMRPSAKNMQAIIMDAINQRDPAVLDGTTPILQSLYQSISELKGMVQNPTSVEMLGKVEANTNSVEASVNDVRKYLTDLQVQATQQTAIRTQLTKDISAVSWGANDTAVAGSTELYESLAATSKVIIVFVILVIIVGVVSLAFINMSVVRKLKDFVGMLANFTSGDGDLTKRIPVTSEDEIGQLAKHVNVFVASIQDIIQQVKNASDDVASGNTELAATMEELSSTFNNQSEQVNSVALNMSGISNTSQNVVMSLADNIAKMQDSNDAISNGNSKLQEVMGTMRNMKRQSETLGETISNLVQSSSKIGEILSVINDVADQTNLLALNAAIEAARAGDAGRGFAVVADEVRKLAERTQRSTSEIAQIITTLQKDSGMASSEMTKTAEGVNTGMEGIQATSELFETVVEAVGGVSSSTSKVNEEVNQQYEMTNSVTDNTQAIASGIEESVHVVNEVSSTVTHLQKQAETLKAIVAQFKV